MPEEKKTLVERPLPQRGGWRWLLALMLGICTWWALGWWLEPRPLWKIDLEASAITTLCEDNSGKWLATFESRMIRKSQKEAEIEIVAFQIRDALTGQICHTLMNPEQELPNNLYHDLRLVACRIVADALWRCTLTKTSDGYCYQLRAWHFISDSKERVVQEWNVKINAPFEIHFSENGSPLFMVRTEFPWQVGLPSVFLDQWSGLAQLLALQNGVGRATATIPWIRSYQIRAEPTPSISQLASWTLPPLRWSPPAIATDMGWVSFGDCRLPEQWRNDPSHGYCQPGGLLHYDVMTGQQRADISIARSPKQALSIKSCGNLLRIQNDSDLRQIWTYDGKSGKQLSRLKESFALSYLGTVLRDRSDSYSGIYRENSDYDHLCWRGSAVACTAVVPPERDEHYEVGQPIYLQGNYIGYTGILRYQPQLFLWLGKHWKWFERWVYKRWPYSMECLYFHDRTTGKMVWKLPRVHESKLMSESSHHFYTRCFYVNRLMINGRPTERAESTLECWAIPFRFYSSWWSRGAGLLVFVMFLILRRKRPLTLAS